MPKDPFADDQFAPLDTRPGDVDQPMVATLDAPSVELNDFTDLEGDEALKLMQETLKLKRQQAPPVAPEPEPVPEPAAAVPPPAPVPVVVVPPAAPEPEVLETDAGRITLDIFKGKHRARVEPTGGGRVQVFYGGTEKELMQQILSANAHANQKLNELYNQQRAAEPAPQPAPVSAERTLTADEKFKLKTLMETDPEAALEFLMKAKTGKSLNELGKATQKAEQTGSVKEIETANNDFKEAHPEFEETYKCQENLERILGFLVAKHKVGYSVPPGVDLDDAVISALYRAGVWTAAEIGVAFETLRDKDALVELNAEEEEETPPAPVPAVEPPPPPAAPVPAAAEPVPAPAQIVTARRPRASFGLHNSDVTQVTPPAEPKGPSDDDLDNLTDEEIAKLYSGTSRLHRQQGRR